ncbi:TOBE domain-containing protein [Natronomonas sp. LN261]|jgi:molybdate transport system regulatory protein|uniref:TOBE domain-containing protein n=1 Tax=Natronomonas sp. LN261 TaxID=2750669 RepID=UPI0015EE4DC9|nr:TOBE domain-containing protein [Natronomonas sp. LN261]
MNVGVEARLRAGDVTFGAADAELLRSIGAHGSVQGAAEALGRSRARALNRVAALEEGFGPLVERQRGGADGGGSRLTADAETLLARFDRLRATLSETAAVPESVLSGEIRDREGEFGSVETDAGVVRALLVDRVLANGDGGSEGGASGGGPAELDVGTEVQVSVQADAVTLYRPADAPDGGATSARNRLPGSVADVESGESIVRVGVDVGTDASLLVLITRESRRRLGIEPGADVVASFKTTATRATAIDY